MSDVIRLIASGDPEVNLTPNSTAIEVAEDLLDKVKRGVITGVVGVAVYHDGTTDYYYSTLLNINAVGRLQQVSGIVLDQINEMEEEDDS